MKLERGFRAKREENTLERHPRETERERERERQVRLSLPSSSFPFLPFPFVPPTILFPSSQPRPFHHCTPPRVLLHCSTFLDESLRAFAPLPGEKFKFYVFFVPSLYTSLPLPLPFLASSRLQVLQVTMGPDSRSRPSVL